MHIIAGKWDAYIDKRIYSTDYWGEVRDEGIVPAYRRNYYGGVIIRF
jgi:hypothetical protein